MNENKIIDGKIVSSQIRQKIKILGDKLKSQTGRTPGLAVVLVGGNPASRVYVKNKIEKTRPSANNKRVRKGKARAFQNLPDTPR